MILVLYVVCMTVGNVGCLAALLDGQCDGQAVGFVVVIQGYHPRFQVFDP